MTDPLAKFADRDREVRDRIALIIHRRGTYPTPYETHAAANTGLVDAYKARATLIAEMRQTASGVPWELLMDATLAVANDLRAAEQNLAADLSWELRWRQDQAWRSYEPNLAIAS
ncbi:MAG TPA: hypothetical protein VFW65_18960 [Pseudonocardiaceae bacterium]|nr:hypothetical protein [Pseudonocardiaceae bacterium]